MIAHGVNDREGFASTQGTLMITNVVYTTLIIPMALMLCAVSFEAMILFSIFKSSPLTQTSANLKTFYILTRST